MVIINLITGKEDWEVSDWVICWCSVALPQCIMTKKVLALIHRCQVKELVWFFSPWGEECLLISEWSKISECMVCFQRYFYIFRLSFLPTHTKRTKRAHSLHPVFKVSKIYAFSVRKNEEGLAWFTFSYPGVCSNALFLIENNEWHCTDLWYT